MADWSTDIGKAPRGYYDVVPAGPGKTTSRRVFKPEVIIAAGATGEVCLSYWLDGDDEKRWSMFTRESGPIAWQPYPCPRAYLDDKGKTRYAVDLPSHPTMAESWFQTFMRERRGKYLDWRAARSGVAA